MCKLWNICAKILAQRSHQGIETNSYLVHAQTTGRQMVRSERNIRPVAGARTSPPGADPDPSQGRGHRYWKSFSIDCLHDKFFLNFLRSIFWAIGFFWDF